MRHFAWIATLAVALILATAITAVTPAELYADDYELVAVRQQTYDNDGPDLRAVHGSWPWDAVPVLCPQGGTGPWVEHMVALYEQVPASVQAINLVDHVEIGVMTVWLDAETQGSVLYAYCHNCTDKWRFETHYDTPIDFWITHDSNGWTWYIDDGGGWRAIMYASDSEAGMGAAKHMQVGGQSTDEDSGTGVFFHNNLWVMKPSAAGFHTFVPSNTTTWLPHGPRFWTYYTSRLFGSDFGSTVGVWGPSDCP